MSKRSSPKRGPMIVAHYSNAAGNPIPFEIFADMTADVRGSHIVPDRHSFTKVFDGALVRGHCTKHDIPFYGRAAALVVAQFRHPCALCAEEVFLESKDKQTSDDFNRILQELKKHYEHKPYTYDKAEESYYMSGEGGWDSGRKITVTCTMPGHGDFIKSRSGHLETSGCYECSKQEIIGKHRLRYRNLDELRAAVIAACPNPEDYDFSRMVFGPIGRTKQSIGCKHGWKDRYTTVLMRGGGCQQCSADRMWAQRKTGNPDWVRILDKDRNKLTAAESAEMEAMGLLRKAKKA